jgi:hypothetical protein
LHAKGVPVCPPEKLVNLHLKNPSTNCKKKVCPISPAALVKCI